LAPHRRCRLIEQRQIERGNVQRGELGVGPLKAVEALPGISRVMDEGNDLAVVGLTEAEIETVISLMQRMLANVEAATAS
jgi:hypothetical protein